jgi:hypothetical protein
MKRMKLEKVKTSSKGKAAKAHAPSHAIAFMRDKPVHVHMHVEADTLHDAARQLKHHMGKLGVKRGRKPGPTSISEALSE